jgi:hypothetical protein
MILFSVLINLTRFKYEYIFYRHIMNCQFCNTRLRKCKFEVVEKRTFHYKCYELECQKKYDIELQNFCDWFLQHGIIVRI